MMRKILVIVLGMAIVAGVALDMSLHPLFNPLSFFGVKRSIPEVPLQTKAEFLELRVLYRQDLDVIAQLEDDQHKIETKIAEKLKDAPITSALPNEILDLRVQWKQDSDTISDVKKALPTIDAAWVKKSADAVKGAYLPDTWTVEVPNSLSGIKFAEKPKPDAGKK